MNIAVIGYGDMNTPSHRFRFQAYEKLFAEEGCYLSYVFKSDIENPAFWQILEQSDVIVNQKSVLNRSVAKKIMAIGKPVFFDFDDAVWTRPGKPYSWLTQKRVDARLAYWLGNVKGVMAANDYLASYARKYSANVKVIPMALDLEQWKPRVESKGGSKIRVGWNGSPGNLHLLNRLTLSLERWVADNLGHVEVSVFCGKRPDFRFEYDYHPYREEKEVDFVKSLDVGLLPLDADPYMQGKSPIKALQYLACGVVVVGNENKGGGGYLKPDTFIKVEGNDFGAALKLIVDGMYSQDMASKGLSVVRGSHHIGSLCSQITAFLGQ